MFYLEDRIIAGIIYDLDGTLVSSSLCFSEIRKQLGCERQQDVLTFIEQLGCEQQRQKANQIVYQHEWQDALGASVIEGAKEMIAWCDQLSIPQAIVTRNNAQAAQQKVDRCQLDIDWVITREQFAAKPDPSALLHISNVWQIKPANILYVGDYVYDIEAAERANMPSLLVNANAVNDFAHRADYHFDTLLSFYHHVQSMI